MEGTLPPIGAKRLHSLSKCVLVQLVNTNLPLTIKPSPPTWYPFFTKNSSTVTLFSFEYINAFLKADFNSSFAVIWTTPLLPDESTGFTIIGNVSLLSHSCTSL